MYFCGRGVLRRYTLHSVAEMGAYLLEKGSAWNKMWIGRGEPFHFASNQFG